MSNPEETESEREAREMTEHMTIAWIQELFDYSADPVASGGYGGDTHDKANAARFRELAAENPGFATAVIEAWGSYILDIATNELTPMILHVKSEGFLEGEMLQLALSALPIALVRFLENLVVQTKHIRKSAEQVQHEAKLAQMFDEPDPDMQCGTWDFMSKEQCVLSHKHTDVWHKSSTGKTWTGGYER